jgi:hypothetical protein
MMRRLLRIAMFGAAVGLLAACSHEPLDDRPPEHGEIPPGPGLFSGAEGGFDLLGGKSKKRRY